jgi:SH3-like domain-containing protein
MKFFSPVKSFVIGLSLSLLALTPALAREMVSIKGSVVNVRESPTTKSDVLWELTRGYPLQVLKRQGQWLKVRDFENDQGWVFRTLTGKTPYYVVKASIANVRKGPGTNNSIVGKAERYDVVRTRSKKGSWVQVEMDDGLQGWISKSLLWGW